MATRSGMTVPDDQLHGSRGSQKPRSRADLRREHLLESARALFMEQGFHQTGIAQIAAESGIKVGQIYRDFTSKDDIIAAICERDVNTWLDEDQLREAVELKDRGAIRAWMDRFVQNDEPPEKCRLIAEIVAEAGRNPRIGELTRSIDRRVRQSLSVALGAMAPAKDRDADREALINFVLAFGTGVMTRRALHPEQPFDNSFGYVTRILDDHIAGFSRG